MGSTNKTTNYKLSQFIGTDIPSWLSDYNGDMEKIDDAMKVIEDKADAGATDITGLTARMTSAETNIGNLQGASTALDTRVTVNENNIDTVHHEVVTNAQEIEDINDNKLPVKVESNVTGAEMNFSGNTVSFNDTNKVRGIDFRSNEYIAIDHDITASGNDLLLIDTIKSGNVNRIASVINPTAGQYNITVQKIASGSVIEDHTISFPINGFIAGVASNVDAAVLTLKTGTNSYLKLVADGVGKQLRFLKNDGTGETLLFTVQGV